jgi:hypothetical protein
MKTSAQRIAKYNARMLSSLVDPVLSAVYQLACDSFAAHAVDFVPRQVQLRNLLNGWSIPTTDFGPYEAFHGELYHLSKVCSGAAAITSATVLVAKYVAWGLVEVNLQLIASDLYGIIVP